MLLDSEKLDKYSENVEHRFIITKVHIREDKLILNLNILTLLQYLQPDTVMTKIKLILLELQPNTPKDGNK